MRSRPSRTAAVFARYLALQLPGAVAAAGVLMLLVHQEQISSTLAYLLFAGWVAFEIALFPVLRVAYEAGGGRAGVEAMIGAECVAEDDLDPAGHVRLGPERWRAVVEGGVGRVAAGSRVRVLAVERLTLVVAPEPAATVTDRGDD